MDHSIVLGADPSPLAALLLGSHTGSMRPPRASPSGRGGLEDVWLNCAARVVGLAIEVAAPG
jgi:hypothetical protein